MTEQLMTELMEKGSTGVLRNRADRNSLAAQCVALRIAVQVLKRNALDPESFESLLFAPIGKGGGLVIPPLRSDGA
jgi:hypothetical protein